MSTTIQLIRTGFAITILFVAGMFVPVGARSEPVQSSESSADVADQREDADASPRSDAKEMTVLPTPSGSVQGIDALLRLPTGYVGERAPSVAGASESEWRRRFRNTREALIEARTKLEKTKADLDGVAQEGGGTQWAVAAPSGVGSGGGPSQSSSPLSFKLRGELKRIRLDLESVEKEMRDLNIEADLAGVPKDWRGPADLGGVTPSEVGQLLD